MPVVRRAAWGATELGIRPNWCREGSVLTTTDDGDPPALRLVPTAAFRARPRGVTGMDGQRFDAITKQMMASASRRGALRLLTGGALGA